MQGPAQRRDAADKTSEGTVWVDEDGIDSPNHAAPPSAPMGLPGRPLCPTMNIRDAIQSAEARFKEAGIDSARLDAEKRRTWPAGREDDAAAESLLPR